MSGKKLQDKLAVSPDIWTEISLGNDIFNKHINNISLCF